MQLSTTRSEFLTKIAVIILSAICFAAHFHLHNAKLIYLCCLAMCGILIVRLVKHKVLFLLSLFISSYIILLYPYFLNNMSIGTYYELNQGVLYQKTIYLFSVFLAALVFFLKEVPEVPIIQRLPVYDNNFIFYLNLAIMIGVLIFGASGQSITEVGYGQNQMNISTFYVYFPILFLAAFISSGRQKIRLLLVLAVGVLFIVRSLMFGGRGNTISILLMMFLLFFEHRISFSALLILTIVGFAFFSFWGIFRGNPSLANLNWSDMWSFSISQKDKYTMHGNNQNDVFYASVRIITMVDVGILDLTLRLKAFGYFLASIFVPYSVLPPVANLASYNLYTYNSMGGGLIFAYFYAFLSYFGLIGIGKFINMVWTRLRTSDNKYLLTYCILVVVMINGWFAYNPISLFKVCLWGVGYIYVLDVVGNWLVRERV